jgi:hypothetical protein
MKGKGLKCLVLRAVVAGALEKLKKFGTYYIASSPIERVSPHHLQESFPVLWNFSSSRWKEKGAL